MDEQGGSSAEVRATLRVNGRPAQRGAGSRWQVRLSLGWDPETDEHAWLSVVCDPPRSTVASGVWLVPLPVLENALTEPCALGTVHLGPDGAHRVWLEVTAPVGAAARPWAVSVPRRWLRRFLDDVGRARLRPADALLAVG